MLIKSLNSLLHLFCCIRWRFFHKKLELCQTKLELKFVMIEPLLCGIVLGLVPITLLGLFVSAWNQYRRGSGMLDFD